MGLVRYFGAQVEAREWMTDHHHQRCDELGFL
jgi:hypothetical protein